jgi:hypothetical protein
MQDLSHLAAGSLAVSSMSGGNTTSSNVAAQTAPGSPPVDPPAKIQGDPALEFTAKPVSVYERGVGYAPSPPVWKETTDG